MIWYNLSILNSLSSYCCNIIHEDVEAQKSEKIKHKTFQTHVTIKWYGQGCNIPGRAWAWGTDN